jgi:hypothetical protein
VGALDGGGDDDEGKRSQKDPDVGDCRLGIADDDQPGGGGGGQQGDSSGSNGLGGLDETVGPDKTRRTTYS